MAKDKGWIKLDRNIAENWLYDADAFDNFHAFVDLLLMANYEARKICVKGKVIEIKPGQVFTSLTTLATRWGWGKNRVRRFLGTLEGTATVHTDGTADGTTITLLNWAKYQTRRHTDGYADEHADGYADGYADGPQPKKGKKEKNVKEGARPRARTLQEKMDAIKERELELMRREAEGDGRENDAEG